MKIGGYCLSILSFHFLPLSMDARAARGRRGERTKAANLVKNATTPAKAAAQPTANEDGFAATDALKLA